MRRHAVGVQGASRESVLRTTPLVGEASQLQPIMLYPQTRFNSPGLDQPLVQMCAHCAVSLRDVERPAATEFDQKTEICSMRETIVSTTLQVFL